MLSYLGNCLLGSVIILTFALWRLLLRRPLEKKAEDILPLVGSDVRSHSDRKYAKFSIGHGAGQSKTLLWILHLVLALSLYFLDQGNTFEHHGAYNSLLFIVMVVPLNAVIGLLFFLLKTFGLKNFCRIIPSFSAVVGLVIMLRLHAMRNLNEKGFYDIRASDLPGDVCTLPPSLPWFDILPSRAQTFWTGNEICEPAANEQLTASLAEDGTLVAHCANNGAISYKVLPDTSGWPREDKLSQPINNSLQDNVLWRFDGSETRYTGEVSLPSAAGVLVKCGKEEKLLLNVPVESSTLNQKNIQWKLGGSVLGSSKIRPPNIAIIFIDAVSRKQFFRRLPKMRKTLEDLGSSRSSSSSLYQFFNYHIVGFNTDPNTRAMYTGNHTKGEMYRPPIWQQFNTRGNYATCFVQGRCEDWSSLYQKATGSEPESDYEFEALACLPEYEPTDWADRGNFKSYTAITKRCLYGRHWHQWQLEYMSKFVKRMNKNEATPWMLVSHFMEGHEGTGEVIHQIDQDLAKFIRDEINHDNTFVFVVADHGSVMGLNFLFLNDGFVSHKNPILAILAPNKYHDPQHIRANQNRLVTATDIYATLLELHPEPETNPPVSFNATSLFKPISANRTCEDTGISDEYCLCSRR